MDFGGTQFSPWQKLTRTPPGMVVWELHKHDYGDTAGVPVQSRQGLEPA